MGEKKFLIIQTAFIGDVVLATPLAEALKTRHPDCTVHFLVRKGNEPLLANHAFIDHVFVWKKREGKYSQLFSVISILRQHHYDEVFNLQRFLSSGLIVAFAKAYRKTGFDKNPLSFLYSRKVAHEIPSKQGMGYMHEVERNLQLLEWPPKASRPTLFPGKKDYEYVQSLTGSRPYFVMAPASVWFTKQWPAEKWRQLLKRLPLSHSVYIIGAKGEAGFAEQLAQAHPKARNLCGTLSMLQSVALMEKAERVFTNDSAPLHFASAANAMHTAVFCSTVPAFGFGPLAKNSRIAETTLNLTCRPCGLHGRRACPLRHFVCAHSISPTQVFNGVEYYQAIRQHNDHQQLLKVASYFLENKELVGIHFQDGDYVLGDFQSHERIERMRQGKSNSYLIIRDATVLKYFVNKLPQKLFELLDVHSTEDIVIHFPVLNLPSEVQGESFNRPVYMSRNDTLQQLLSTSKGAMLMTGLASVIAQDQQVANETAFYLPLSIHDPVNKAIAVEVETNGAVKVAN